MTTRFVILVLALLLPGKICALFYLTRVHCAKLSFEEKRETVDFIYLFFFFLFYLFIFFFYPST